MEAHGATLSAHSGATVISAADLELIPAPAGTRTHHPIAHGDLVRVIRDRIDRAGFGITREQFAVQTDGQRLFGTFDLDRIDTPGAGLGTALGFRHANNRSMALQMVAGSRVFVCDNLALSGDLKLFKNRHTSGIMGRLSDGIARYLENLPRAIEMLKDRFGVWQAAPLSDDAAKLILYDAVHAGIIPARLRPDVHAAYFDAEKLEYADCAPRSKWGIHNAFTRGFKQLNPGPAYAANIGLTQLLGTDN